MTESPTVTAHRVLTDAVAVLRSLTENGTDEDRLALLRISEGIARQLTVYGVHSTAELTRRGGVRRTRLQIPHPGLVRTTRHRTLRRPPARDRLPTGV